MTKKYVRLEFTIIEYCEEDVLTGSGEIGYYGDGVAFDGSGLWGAETE